MKHRGNRESGRRPGRDQGTEDGNDHSGQRQRDQLRGMPDILHRLGERDRTDVVDDQPVRDNPQRPSCASSSAAAIHHLLGGDKAAAGPKLPDHALVLKTSLRWRASRG